MARQHRVSRLNEQLRREITDIVRNQLRDPRIGVITVTEVRVTSDLEHARVFITSLGGPAEQQETLAGLSAAASYIRGEIGRRLRIRHTPELRFEFDATLEHARRIEALLATVRPPEEASEPPEPSADDETDAEDESDKADDDVA